MLHLSCNIQMIMFRKSGRHYDICQKGLVSLQLCVLCSVQCFVYYAVSSYVLYFPPCDNSSREWGLSTFNGQPFLTLQLALTQRISSFYTAQCNFPLPYLKENSPKVFALHICLQLTKEITFTKAFKHCCYQISQLVLPVRSVGGVAKSK